MKHLLTLTLLASAMARAQDTPKLNARELFYSPPPNPGTNSNASGGGRAGANTASNPASSTTTSSTTTASTNTSSNNTKKQTTAKNASSGGRPATGTTATAGNTNAGSTSGTTSAATSGTSNPAAGPDTVVAQVGQQTGGQTHMINTSVTNGPLGLRYSVLKRDASGAYNEVDPDTSFRTGDAIRLQVEANTAGYLYVVTQGTSGQWQLLFPRREVSGGSNRVEPHIKVEVPGDKGVWKFDEHAGTEKLFVVLARQPEPDLDKLIYAIGNGGTGKAADAGGASGREALLAQASIRDDVVSHLRDQMLSRDLVFEKVDEGTADSAPVKNEKAAYVVNISTAPDARVVKDFALQHR